MRELATMMLTPNHPIHTDARERRAVSHAHVIGTRWAS